MKSRPGSRMAVIVLGALMALLPSCAAGPPTQSAGTARTAAATPAGEAPYRISIMAPYYDREPPDSENSPLIRALEQACAVDLEITFSPHGNYPERFTTVMASRSIPMVINLTSDLTSSVGYLKYVRSGAFWDLTDAIARSTLFTQELTSPAALAATAVDGRNYTFPAIAESARVGLVYRQDWADNLGIGAPETVQDFFDMARAFTERDPDGNGKNDTFGFSYIDNEDKELIYAGFDTIAVALGAPNHWGIVGGQMLPYMMTEPYLQALRLFRDMYEKGYMNPDFPLVKGSAKYDHMVAGNAGIMFTSASNASVPGGKFDALADRNPGARMAYTLLFTRADGSRVTNSVLSAGGLGGIVLSTASVPEKTDVSRIMTFFEDAQLGDNARLIALGVEGIHYTEQPDGAITISRQQELQRVRDGTYNVCYNLIPRRVMTPDYGQPQTPADVIRRQCVANEACAVPDLSNGLLPAEDFALMTRISAIISDARVRFIMGHIDEQGFLDAVAQWRQQGGDKLIQELTSGYEKAERRSSAVG